VNHASHIALRFLFLVCLRIRLGAIHGKRITGHAGMVAEVRQLGKDLQITNGNALKVQVLLYRLQVQEAIVAHVSEHLDDCRSRLADIGEASARRDDHIETARRIRIRRAFAS
jgi:hypothetical protein